MKPLPSRAWDEFVASFLIAMKAKNLSPATLTEYERMLGYFARWLADDGRTTDPLEVTRRDCEAYLAYCSTVVKPATCKARWVPMRSFYNWLVDDDELTDNPMAKVPVPVVPEQPVKPLSAEQCKALIAACAGTDFYAKRDAAIVWTLLDTGLRVGELVALQVGDIDKANGVAYIRRGKGGKGRLVPLGSKALGAVDKYLRARSRRPDADSPWLWLGNKGRLGDSGVRLLLTRRGSAAGIEGLHPHTLRHSFAHMWLVGGGTEGDLQRIGGWENPMVMRRYGSAAATDRAIAAHRHNSPGDRL